MSFRGLYRAFGALCLGDWGGTGGGGSDRTWGEIEGLGFVV